MATRRAPATGYGGVSRPIRGIYIAEAVPDVEIAKSLQKAMASSNVSRSLARVASKLFANAVISPEL